VTDVLRVAAFEIGNPVLFIVLMEAGYAALHVVGDPSDESAVHLTPPAAWRQEALRTAGRPGAARRATVLVIV
jgi:hypothetical protein